MISQLIFLLFFVFFLYSNFLHGINSTLPLRKKEFKLPRRQEATDGTLEARTGRVTAKEGSGTWVCP